MFSGSCSPCNAAFNEQQTTGTVCKWDLRNVLTPCSYACNDEAPCRPARQRRLEANPLFLKNIPRRIVEVDDDCVQETPEEPRFDLDTGAYECAELSAVEDGYTFDPKISLYRRQAMGGKLATIFDVDDPRSYYNWQILVENFQEQYSRNLPEPKFRELIDHEIEMVVFQITGNHDGSVSVICPPGDEGLTMTEELPVLNFVVSYMGGHLYASIEITVVTISPESIQSGKYDTIDRKIVVKNFRSRIKVTKTVLEMPLKLRDSWTYASLNLEKIVKQAWNDSYLVTKLIKVNANVRVRRISFSEKVFGHDELPPELQLNLKPAYENVDKVLALHGKYPLFKAPKDVSWKFRFPQTALPPTTSEKTPLRKTSSLLFEERIRGLQLNVPVTKTSLFHYMNPSEQAALRACTNKSEWENQRTRLQPILPSSQPFEVPEQKPSAEQHAWEIPPELEKSNAGEELMKDWPPNIDTNEVPTFCSYVWGPSQQQSEDAKVVEWDQIEKLDLQPQVLAQVQRQRRGEGFYDIYNAQMVNKTATSYDELDAMKVIAPDIENENLRDSLGNDTLKTYMNPNFSSVRRSLVDPNTDLNYLKEAGQEYEDEESPAMENGALDGGKKHPKSSQANKQSVEEAKYPDETWLQKITKHYKGMNWKLAGLQDGRDKDIATDITAAKNSAQPKIRRLKSRAKTLNAAPNVLDSEDFRTSPFYRVYFDGNKNATFDPCTK